MLKKTQVFLFLSLLGGVGCGYAFQTSQNPLFLKDGVQKVYVAHFSNASNQPGVEDLVYNNLIRVLLSQGRVTLVSDPAIADATLNGSVAAADFSVAGVQPISALAPNTPGTPANPAGTSLGSFFSSGAIPGRVMTYGAATNIPAFNVALSYSATLACSFSLTLRVPPKPPKKTQIWASGFQKSKSFPSANQLDVPGTTSSLINQSEFERALSDLASIMMADVHESMLGAF